MDLHNEPMARVNFEGETSMQNLYDITVACDMNLKFYPYDEQKCTILIESWFYTAQQVCWFS